IELLNFLGAFSELFKAKFQINICTVDNANIWLGEFSNLYKVTMQETQGQIIKGVKYIFSKGFHCVHSNLVKLKQEQKDKNDSTNINTMEKEKSNIISTCKRDTKCLAILNIQLRNILDIYPYIISLTFYHNYPLASSYSLSFHPICNKIIEAFFKLFHNGHGSASVYHTYIKKIQLKYENNEKMLADRAICSNDFDDLNTTLTILSTNISIGSLPLAAMLISDEPISTLSEALNRLKHILLIIVFNNHGSIIGPENSFAKTETKLDEYKVLIMNQ
ncbi:41585_t:CDS:2, partial [Gigaspora margarita]